MVDYKLIITDEITNKVYTLNFRPTQSILSTKLDVSNLTNIPVSKQIWQGWPPSAMENEQLTLAQIGISGQTLELRVNRVAEAEAGASGGRSVSTDSIFKFPAMAEIVSHEK